jgi:hypothetical protein
MHVNFLSKGTLMVLIILLVLRSIVVDLCVTMKTSAYRTNFYHINFVRVDRQGYREGLRLIQLAASHGPGDARLTLERAGPRAPIGKFLYRQGWRPYK